MSSKSKTPAKKPAALPIAKPEAKKIEAKAQATAPAPTKDQRNGITRPGAGTLCAKVWAALDKLHATSEDTTFDAVRALAGKDMADATIRTQRQRWNEYHGVTRDTKKAVRRAAAAKAAPETQTA